VGLIHNWTFQVALQDIFCRGDVVRLRADVDAHLLRSLVSRPSLAKEVGVEDDISRRAVNPHAITGRAGPAVILDQVFAKRVAVPRADLRFVAEVDPRVSVPAHDVFHEDIIRVFVADGDAVAAVGPCLVVFEAPALMPSPG